MDSPALAEFGRIAQRSSIDDFFNIPLNGIDIGRESMPILDISGSFGRESLGLLKLGCDSNDIENSNNNLALSTLSEFSSQNVLDQGFWVSPSRTLELRNQSQFSVESNLSFNPKDLDQPSSILTMGSLNSVRFQGSVNIFNEAFLLNNGTAAFLEKLRSRMYSLPAPSIKKSESDGPVFTKQLRKFSEGNELLNQDKFCEIEDSFADSVFIEANHLSSKFSEEGSNDGFILDETDPPELVSGDFDESHCDKKLDKEQVFKKIDTLLPVDGYQKLHEKISVINAHSSEANNADDNANPNVEEKCETEEENDKKVSSGETECESNPVNNDEPETILKTLSEILSKDDISEKDNKQGQSLLHTLADILGNKSRERSKSFSGKSLKSHYDSDKNGSSFRSKDDSNFSQNSSISKPLPNGASMLKRHSNSFSFPTRALQPKLSTSSFGRAPSFDGSKNQSSGSEKSSEMKKLNMDPSFDFKMRKTATLPSRRGPLKATVPVENFSKLKLKETPPKTLQKLPVLNSRISTPIREMKLKPMAQSTPDNKAANSSIEQSSSQKPGNNSSSATSLSSYKDSSVSKDQSSLQHSLLPRRNSVSEARKPGGSSEFRRSSSLRESGLMKTMKKIRQNISSAGHQSKNALRDCSNLSSKDGSSSSLKFSDTPKKAMKPLGKENTTVV